MWEGAGCFSLAASGVAFAQRWIIETAGAPTATAAAESCETAK